MARTTSTIAPTARTTDAAHRDTLRIDPQEIARILKRHLGAKLLALLAGVETRTVNRWAASQDRPRDEHAARLRIAYQAFLIMEPVEAAPTIRAWFMGMNPQLDDVSPAEAVAEDQFREVLSAARAFVAGG
ncbi:MAG TPA: hypothetical protein VIJ41_01320 [Candidatus Nanopelagicales bacterium]